MSRKSYPNVNAANQYARDVVRGKIVACQFVIQACQRHLDDLMAEKSKSFRYRFDKDLAERAAKFIQLLPLRTANRQSLPVSPCIVLPVITSLARKCIPVPRQRNRRGKSFARRD